MLHVWKYIFDITKNEIPDSATVQTGKLIPVATLAFATEVRDTTPANSEDMFKLLDLHFSYVGRNLWHVQNSFTSFSYFFVHNVLI